MESHFRKLENMYHNHPMNGFIKARISISDRKATLEIPIREDFFHAAGAVHGSIYFKALDDAGFFAANSIVRDCFVLTTSFNTYLTAPVVSGKIRAEGELVYSSGKQFIAEAILYNEDDEQIGRGSGMYIKSKINLTEEMGYKL